MSGEPRPQSYPVELTADEIQLVTCALAGNHPPRLAHLRMGVLRKLAKADPTLRRARRAE